MRKERRKERLLDNYPPMSLNPLTMTLTVTCHALAMDQSKSSKGPIVFKLSSASTKTNPRGLKLSNSRGTFLSWRMELPETPKKSASASRENPKEECKFCRTKLVIIYGRVAYISTENIFTISKRKEYSDKPEFRGLENKTSSQLCAELGFNVAKSDILSDRICKPCGRNLRNTYRFYKRQKSVEENDRANAEASDKTAETERRVNEGECSDAPSRFKRQLPTTISPDRRPTSKAAKRSSGAKKSLAFRQEKENLTNVDAHLNVEGLLDKPTTQVKTIMHGSILPVTIPPGQPRGQVQPFGPGGGELFEAILSRGGGGAGQIEYNFVLFL